MQVPQSADRIPIPRRRLSFGKLILLILLLLFISAVVLLALTGLVPGLSRLVGAAGPRDLGVKAAPADFSRPVKEIGFQLNNLPGATDPTKYRKVYSGQVPVDRVFTGEELSALLSYNHVTWWPMKDVQVKVHANGEMEVALNAITKNIPMENMPSSVLRHLPAALPAEVPVYVKGRMDVVGPTQVKLSIQRLELGRIPLPANVLSNENQQRATDYMNGRIKGMPGLSIQQLSFQDGKVRFKGTFPKEFRRVPVGP